MKKSLIISISLVVFFLLSSDILKAQDERLYNTWSGYENGELTCVIFNPNNSYDFFNKELSTYELRDRADEFVSSFEVTKGKINRVSVKVNMVDSYGAQSIHIHGIYEFISDTKLRLEFCDPSKPLLQEFTNAAVIFTSDQNELKKMLEEQNAKKDTLFTYRDSDIRKVQDERLYNTWNSYSKGKLGGVAFNPDNSFDIFSEEINTYEFRKQFDQFSSSFEANNGSVNRITVKLNMEGERSLHLHGIYEFISDTKLRLDFSNPGEPLLQEFTSAAIIFTSDQNELELMLQEQNSKKAIVLSHGTGDKLITDTLRFPDPGYIKMDSLINSKNRTFKKSSGKN